ncbi:hypothetical protein IF1G_06218 [Cordyceps javanica]|uniref:Uncharacterized protein n=1 Tax=Cordyceps javanica TaxID=43265 RepID=A0A545V0I4_9HYPO|nr:hypothetical protein IF1G_06218 [Cordyceps javanica]
MVKHLLHLAWTCKRRINGYACSFFPFIWLFVSGELRVVWEFEPLFSEERRGERGKKRREIFIFTVNA